MTARGPMTGFERGAGNPSDHPAATERISFLGMGSDCTVIVTGGPPGGAQRARARVADLEGKWSRFLVKSEISRLNSAGGAPLEVSSDTRELIDRALDAWRLTGGAFDATVLGAVVDAGYDRSFEQMERSAPTECSSARRPFGGGAEVIDVEGNTVVLARGVGFDPGGIGKGLAADLVARDVMDHGAAGVCVNLGGDVRLAGDGPGGSSWTVAVEHPWVCTPIALIGLDQGAVATSTTLRRRWWRDGRVQHHLIDPRTGLPSDSDVNLSTVVAGEAWATEVLAKAVLLRGSEHPFDILGGTGAQGLVVDRAGRVQTTDGLDAFTSGQPVAVSVDSPRGAGPKEQILPADGAPSKG